MYYIYDVKYITTNTIYINYSTLKSQMVTTYILTTIPLGLVSDDWDSLKNLQEVLISIRLPPIGIKRREN